MAMILNPDVYKKAQVEIDEVVGSLRLPDLTDQNQLPYLSSTVFETIRYADYHVLVRISNVGSHF
jgi:hypothetical protein